MAAVLLAAVHAQSQPIRHRSSRAISPGSSSPSRAINISASRSGEVPLWNPYNNGGLPFIADTQAAVFYPPRLLTIGLSSLAGGWTYHALELEMTFHVLAFTLMMYAFVRRLTGQRLSARCARQ